MTRYLQRHDQIKKEFLNNFLIARRRKKRVVTRFFRPVVTAQEKQARERARQVISTLVDDVCLEFGHEYNRIAIRNQRSRLGSCSSQKNLNFNWQIVKFPFEMMRYIVVHEVAHLAHQNHSKSFWAEVERMDTEFKVHHKWIKTNAKDYLVF